MAMIETVNLGQGYGGQYVLKNVNLKIERGEVFSLIGPTGAGKTTLLRLLDLLELPSSGRIYFDGIDVARDRHKRLGVRRRMSFVQQKPVVFGMSVYDNVACGPRWRRQEDDAVRQKVEAVLELVGMSEYRARNARTLSGGETKRVAIARALATDPEVLLLDEPTANLDPVSASKIEEVLARVIREQRPTVIMATHDMPQGQRLAGRIGVLMNGEILQIGSSGDIFTSPGSKEVAEFVGVENILAGTVVARDDSLVTVALSSNSGTIQAVSDYNVGESVYALIRPEDITLTLSRDISSARNTFTGRIARVASVGPLLRVEIDCGFPLFGLVTKRSAEEMGITVGTTVYSSFKASAVGIIKRWN